MKKKPVWMDHWTVNKLFAKLLKRILDAYHQSWCFHALSSMTLNIICVRDTERDNKVKKDDKKKDSKWHLMIKHFLKRQVILLSGNLSFFVVTNECISAPLKWRLFVDWII